MTDLSKLLAATDSLLQKGLITTQECIKVLGYLTNVSEAIDSVARRIESGEGSKAVWRDLSAQLKAKGLLCKDARRRFKQLVADYQKGAAARAWLKNQIEGSRSWQ